MCGEFTVEQIGPGKFECDYEGEPRNLHKIIFASDKRIATKLFLDYLKAAERAGRR